MSEYAGQEATVRTGHGTADWRAQQLPDSVFEAALRPWLCLPVAAKLILDLAPRAAFCKYPKIAPVTPALLP